MLLQVRTASCGATACVNSFGDEQLAVDMLADKLLFEALRFSHVCKWACSEEVPEPVDMEGTQIFLHMCLCMLCLCIMFIYTIMFTCPSLYSNSILLILNLSKHVVRMHQACLQGGWLPDFSAHVTG